MISRKTRRTISSSIWQAGEVEFEYPLGYLRRRVGSNGMFRVHAWDPDPV